MSKKTTDQENDLPVEVSADVAVLDAPSSPAIMSGVREAGRIWTSFHMETIKDKSRVYNALNGGDTKISDIINSTITMVDCAVQSVELVDEKTGEVSIAPRVSIVDKSGKIFYSTAFGVYNSLMKLHAVFGTLHFPDGLPLQVLQLNTKRGRTFSLKVVL